MLSTGDTAPNIDLPTDEGATFSSSSSKSAIVVFFYPKADTPGCTNEAKDFSELKEQFEELNIQVIGISPDPVKKLEKFKAKHDLSVTLGSDEDMTVLNAYGVWVEKSMYGRQYMGVERSTFLITADGKIAEIWRKVRVKEHAQKVLTAAKAAIQID